MRTTRSTNKDRPVGTKEKTWGERGKTPATRERPTTTGPRTTTERTRSGPAQERTAYSNDRPASSRSKTGPSEPRNKEQTTYSNERPTAPRSKTGTSTLRGKDRQTFSKDRPTPPGERTARRSPAGKTPFRSPREDSAKEPEANRSDFLAGRNPVLEALRSGRPISKIFIQSGERLGSVHEIVGLAKDKGVLVQETEQGKLDLMSSGVRHQGVVALVSPVPYSSVDEILQYAHSKGEKPCIVLLDGLKDPQNLGNLIRSAEVAGAHGILIPQRRNVQLSGAVAKASAGAVEYMKVAQVGNVAQTLEMLKKQGMWIVGADAEAPKVYYETDLTGPVVIVIGGEGEGMARLTKDRCDLLVRIPVQGRIGSLNAATAGAILLFDVARQRNAVKA